MTDARSDPMAAALADFRRPEAAGWGDAWVGLEPTFQSKKSVRKWRKMAAEPGGEDAYFLDGYMLRTQKEIAKEIRKRYAADREQGRPWCVFETVERDDDLDQWDVRRRNLLFRWPGDELEPFEVRVSLDPETFEYSVKPVPLAWFYDERFVAFLERYLWRVPADLGLTCSVAHGGGQFSLSAKTFLTGGLLADDVADRLNHPELATWVMDWPNPDDRAFRATRPRFAAFRGVLESYRAGGFHPRAIGVLTAEDVYLDRGFGPAASPPAGMTDRSGAPAGDAADVFRTNFAFGRALRLQAQSVDPGYWQAAHPDEDGYRPDQVMRYSEGNLNRLQIAGEWHVKSGKVLEPDRVPELDAPLDAAMLTTEAAWENRAQMGRTSARDYVEAVLLEVHHARYLQGHPGVAVAASLSQDMILGDAEETLRRRAPAVLDRLRREARAANLEASRGRVRSGRVEPEALFWAAWKALPAGERGEIAREAVGGFIGRVGRAAEADPRTAGGDPMEPHRHRIHPLLWDALAASPGGRKGDPASRELAAWRAGKAGYLARRPAWSQLGDPAPWE